MPSFVRKVIKKVPYDDFFFKFRNIANAFNVIVKSIWVNRAEFLVPERFSQ